MRISLHHCNEGIRPKDWRIPSFSNQFPNICTQILSGVVDNRGSRNDHGDGRGNCKNRDDDHGNRNDDDGARDSHNDGDDDHDN